MKRPIIRRSAVILAMALAAGVILRAHAHVRITTNITWSEDVRPIFQNKCMGCHSPVGIAPAYVNLTTYGAKPGQSGARDWAKAIEEEILTGRMPPWQADPRFEKFSNAHQLTKEETNLIISWIRGGAPQGPRRDLPAPAEFLARDWSLGKPDIEIEMPEDYVIPAGSREASYSFNFKLPETFGKDEKGKDILAKWVSGYEFFPGDPKVVHSIIALAHDPESVKEETIEVEVKKPYDPLAPEEKLEARRTRKMPIGTQFVGQYVRGDFPVLFPADAGRKLRAGSTIEVRVFYRKQGVEGANEEARDRSKLGLYFAKQPVDLLVESNRVSNDNFSVPANASNQEVKAAWTLNESLHLIGLNPHLGVLGKDFEVTATYPDGKSKTLLLVPDYRHKWEASYVFETPVAAPAGTRLDLVAHYDNTPRNKNNPAKELKNVRGEEGAPAQLTTYVDYLLDEHLIVATPTPPPSPPQQASEGTGMVITDQVGRGGILFGDGSAADQKTTGTDVTSIPSIGEAFAPNAGQKEVYWCPMRGTKEGQCGVKDYDAAGKCDKCGMKLIPKAAFFEKVPKDQIASRQGGWQLTKEGSQAVYWCPNRGRPDHQLRDYVAPVRCDICGEQLLHKSQFKLPKTYACTNSNCKLHYDETKGMKTVFYTPGLCPECLQPVEPMGHMDHRPVHGGQLLMADNLYHHIEGTLPAKDEFRVYFYDDWKKPLDPRNFAGKVVIQEFNEKTEEVSEKEIELTHAKLEDEFLTAKIPEIKEFPTDFSAKVWLAGKENLFSFAFGDLSREPLADAAPTTIVAHSHIVRPPLTIPEKPADIVREILRRDEMIQNNIDAKHWLEIHIPALDAADLAEALKQKEEGLDVQTRGKLRKAITRTTLAALGLHDAGDLNDEARVRTGYKEFTDALRELKIIFPDAAKMK